MAGSGITYDAFSRFVMRFPRYPIKTIITCLDNEKEMLRMFNSNDFKNSILFASPALYDELKRLLSGEIERPKNIKKIRLSLMKYLARMSTRCTPFASLASCGCVSWGNSNNIVTDDLRVEHFRLDMLCSCAISKQLLRDHEIRERLHYRTNSTMYALGKQVRYIYYSHDQRSIFQVRELPVTRPMKLLLSHSRDFVSFMELQNLLTKSYGLEIEASRQYIHRLIDHQLLTSEIDPMVTGGEMLNHMTERISLISNQRGNVLSKLKNSINQLSSRNSVDENEQTLHKIHQVLEAESVKCDPKFMVQLDLFSRHEQETIDKRIIQQIKKGMEFLCRVTPENRNVYLEAFKQRFTARYQDQEIPLLEALDPDVGVGYIETQDKVSNPLIDGLAMPVKHKTSQSMSMTTFQQLMMNRIMQHDWSKSHCIELTEKDISHLPCNDSDLPLTMSAMFKIHEKLADGKFLLSDLYFTGRSAAVLLGRFAYGDNDIMHLVKQIVEYEQDAIQDKLIAEIAHVPQERTGNILSRPHIRDYEICYLSNSSITDANRIDANDLLVSVKLGRIVLRSKRLKKEILPRLTNAHNFIGTVTTPVYRFLCDLQHQQGRTSLVFTLGPLLKMDRLPRIVYRNIIFCRERWLIRCNQLPFSKGQITPKALKDWSLHFALPRYVQLVVGDNKLLVDTGNVMSVEAMMSELGKTESFVLEEFIPCTGIAGNNTGEDFMNECVVPLMRIKHEKK